MSMIKTAALVEHLDRGPRSKDELVAAVAAAIPPSSYVNLGIGAAHHRGGFLDIGVRRSAAHTENGMLNMGPLLALIKSIWI
jgi:3-oxoadipate CoA-transferase, beta subunit